MPHSYPVADSVSTLSALFTRVRAAQAVYASFTQHKVDEIFCAAAAAANKARIPLAKMAVEETGMGIFEDKVIKNHFAAENIYHAYRHVRTCGLLHEDESAGIKTYAEPVGVVAAVIPTTNPTSTVIFKTLLALKTRNGIIISPHPRAKNCSISAAKLVLEAAVAAGAPEGIIGWIDVPGLEMSNFVMAASDCILATGGPGMVKAAYSSGKPAIGVGAGNVPALIDESADVVLAVSSIIHSKTFDNGLICASEQSVLVPGTMYENVKNEFTRRGCYFLNPEETDKIRRTIIVNGALNAKVVGQRASVIAALAGINVPDSVKILIGEVESVELTEEFAHEKLSPVLAMYKTSSFDDALDKAERLVHDGGMGHTASIYLNERDEKEKLNRFITRMTACRVLINTPSSYGGIGDIYNFKLRPSLTLGCGSWGGNSISENVGVSHLLNIKTVAARRENMLWFRTPDKVYIKRGCLPTALDELGRELNKKRAFIVTDRFLYENGYTRAVTDTLNEWDIEYTLYSNVEPDPTLACAREGAALMAAFKPDVIIALGGGSPIDAAKIMWLLYEHPEVDFADMAMRFADIRKRVYGFPKLGEKAYFVAIPTTAGTGSEVTPFAVITDEVNGIKYPLADYELLPDMAVVDADLMLNAPKSLTAASGIDAVTHAIEAYVSTMASDYTNALALGALKILFEYLPRAYERGSKDPEAREKAANAATMAGMAFANAFLGLCHSMAHKLGSFHHLPHGIANALLMPEIIRYNATDVPAHMGTFSQYGYPHAVKRYVEMADALGLKGVTDAEKVEAFITAFEDLKTKIEIKTSIKDYGVNEQQFLDRLDEMTGQAFDDQCTGANPRYPMIAEIKEIYLKAYYGNEPRYE